MKLCQDLHDLGFAFFIRHFDGLTASTQTDLHIARLLPFLTDGHTDRIADEVSILELDARSFIAVIKDHFIRFSSIAS